MKNRILSLILALFLLIGFIPDISASGITMDNITLKDLAHLDENDSIFTGEVTTDAQVVIDDSNDNEDYTELFSDETLEDGIYEIENVALKENTQNDSAARDYLERKSTIEVKDGKMTITVSFTSASIISDLGVLIGTMESGSEDIVYKDIDFKEIRDIDNDTVDLKFVINSINEKIKIKSKVKPPMLPFAVTANIDFSLIEDTLAKIDDDENDVTDNVLADGEYTIENKILNETGTSESLAAGFIEKQSILISEKGALQLTLNINSISTMNNINVVVDGKNVESKVTTGSNGSGSLTFNINYLSSDITVECNIIPAGNMAVKFKVVLDKSTLKDNDGGAVEAPSEPEPGISINENATYKIKNKINITGGDASYLDEHSIIEVKDGVINLTLNFNRSNFMEGRTIRLNNDFKDIEHRITSNENKTSVKLTILSLNDEIHIVKRSTSSRNAEEEFTINLLPETLQKQTTTSGSGSGSTEEEDDDDSSDDEIEDGTYTIKNKVLKENSDSESVARDYLDKESVIEVKNGKMYLILKFTEGKLMSNINVKVEGDKVSHKVVYNSGKKHYIKFRIGSLSDEILVSTDVNTGTSIGKLSVKFRVELRKSTLEEDDDAADFEDSDDDNEDEDEDDDDHDEITGEEDNILDGSGTESGTTTPDNSGNGVTQINPGNSGSSQFKRVTYKVKNEIITDSQIGYQASRSAVNEISYYEIENDTNHYITLGFSQTNMLGNIRLSIGGNQISYETVSKNSSKNTMELRFKIPSLSTQVTVTANISAIGRDISFGIKFLESTLELVSIEESENPITGNAVAGTLGGTSNSSGGFSASDLGFGSMVDSISDISLEEALGIEDISSEAKEYFKRYTISNEVVSDSAMGRTMARKYLNETSIIEEIDGKFFATVTFTGTNSMGNFKFEVNGKTVEYSVVLNDSENGIMSFRFPISSINDDIRVYIHIKPVKMNIDFGIKFLEDTLILIEEGVIGDEDSKSSLVDNLTLLNGANGSNGGNISVWKIAIITAVLSTILNFSVGGILYLIIKKRKKKSIKAISE